jgi:hypothetical protein
MGIFNQKKKEKEEKNERISAFENEINFAFEQMKQKGVDKIPVSVRTFDEKAREEAAKEYIPELNQSFVSHDAKIYYPFEAYATADYNLFQAKKDYEIINIVTGNLSKEKVTTPIFADEIPGNMKEGFEVSNRFYHNISMNEFANKNLWYITRTDFYVKTAEHVREFAEIISESGLTIDDFRNRIAKGIDEYRQQTLDLSDKARVFDNIKNMESMPESYFKPYLAVGEMIKNSKR